MQAGKPMSTPGSRFNACCNWIGLRGARCGCDGVELGGWLNLGYYSMVVQSIAKCRIKHNSRYYSYLRLR